MLRSMLSASSALRNHQTYMDVVANNIANVNTTGYKTMRSTFHELLSQQLSAGAAPTQQRGGVNPVQIGLGMTLGSVDGIFTQGTPQSTGRTHDLAIQGNGFFVYQGAGQNLYSRDGAMDLGLDGSLLNPSTGLRVMGWNADANGTINTTGPLEAIMIPLNQGLAQATQNINMNGNLDSQLAARSVSGMQTVANTVTGFATAAPITATGGAWTQTELTAGDYYVEIQGAAGSQQFRVVDSQGNPVSIAQVGSSGQTYGTGWQSVSSVMGTTFDTGRGLQITLGSGTGTPAALTNGVRGAGAASVHYVPQSVSTDIQVYDSLGTAHTITLTFTKNTAATNSWTWQASCDEAGVGVTPATTTPMAFGSTGQYVEGTTATTLALTFTNGAANQAIKLDFQGLTQLAEDSELGVPTQDGYAPGQLNGFDLTSNGEVECTYANGMRKILGQIAIADFANPGGLLREGDNLFTTSSNSGAPTTGAPGTGGRGNIMAGYLEMANVDLAQQFTNMISAQRGFQANSRVITTSDQMLEELVNLVR